MRRLLFTGLLSIAFAACTATGDVEDDGPVSSINNGGNASPGSHHGDSSSSASVSGDSAKAYLSDYIGMVDVLAASLTRDNAEFLVSEFSIAKHEVDQGLYRRIMGDIPKTDALGDNYPVFNVSWFDAALFCNALSKRVFLDTAYVYSSVDASGSLVNLSINYSVAAVRLPTEMEWDIAARAGTSTTYFWDTDVAYKYAYYAQSNGPAMVATYMPNSLGLYDMAGNVAECLIKFVPCIGLMLLLTILLILLPCVLLFTTTYFAYAIAVVYYLTIGFVLWQYLMAFFTNELVNKYIVPVTEEDDDENDENTNIEYTDKENQ